jgi:hypothetical protein
VDGAGDQLLAGAGLPGDEHGGVGRRDLLHLAEHGEERGAVADHLHEVVLAADLLLEVCVLALEARLQRGDLLEGLHVAHRQGDLIGGLLQELRIRLRVPVPRPAGEVHDADAPPAHDEGHGADRPDALLGGPPLLGELRLDLQVAPEERSLAIERAADVAVPAREGVADLEVLRPERAFEGDKPEQISGGLVERESDPVEVDHSLQGLADRLEQGFLGQVRDDRVVDLEERPVALGGLRRPPAPRRTSCSRRPGPPG